MRAAALICISLLFTVYTFAGEHDENQAPVSAVAIVREINLARQNPSFYATFIEEMRANFVGKTRMLPGRVHLQTQEGVRALDEAARFLRKVRPLPALALSPGLCQAALDHCHDQSAGALGHKGSDRSMPGDRISRYGVWSQGWAENIAYGQRSARDIVLALLIDDGVRSRGHRKNIFNPSFSVAGAGYGAHARFGSVCSIDFAGAFVDHAYVRAEPTRF